MIRFTYKLKSLSASQQSAAVFRATTRRRKAKTSRAAAPAAMPSLTSGSPVSPWKPLRSNSSARPHPGSVHASRVNTNRRRRQL